MYARGVKSITPVIKLRSSSGKFSKTKLIAVFQVDCTISLWKANLAPKRRPASFSSVYLLHDSTVLNPTPPMVLGKKTGHYCLACTKAGFFISMSSLCPINPSTGQVFKISSFKFQSLLIKNHAHLKDGSEVLKLCLGETTFKFQRRFRKSQASRPVISAHLTSTE